MSISPINEVPAIGGGLVQISSREELIRQRLAEERRRLEKEAGIEKRPPQHFHKPVENLFSSKS